MTLHLLSIIRYNFKLIYKKIFLTMGCTVAILFFHTLFQVGYSDDFSALEVYMLSIGGVNIEQLHLLQMFIVLLPYLGITLVVDVYITQVMARHAINTIIRIEKKIIFMLSHVISLFSIIVIMLLIYHGMLLIISFFLYDGSQMNATLFPWLTKNHENAFFVLFVYSFFGQLLGTFCISCVQLAISTKLNRLSSGFIIIAIIYFIQFIYPFVLAQHTFVSNILIDNSAYLRFLLTQMLIMGGCIVYLYFNIRKNIIFFSERS
ncbi:hypothetical protein CD30_02050 [Ureibacillus massiliensis 4400831 = CIP 108448 = CCUG 49529]|uniref:Permease n=1 Tax=Ureibacillus massiliensis 4400831 = CIP 108448 = CCUG 49529 TaxID=1211035 RepID=A0A0A3J5C5_9BACL|nr:hypothetical protein CD30_02050 [Ureibacillus massiliensis 4400831 = CIP 108448 = CCUG 49529]